MKYCLNPCKLGDPLLEKQEGSSINQPQGTERRQAKIIPNLKRLSKKILAPKKISQAN